MNKIAYVITAILYVLSGLVFGSTALDNNDPFLQILSTIALMAITLGFVLTTLLYLRKENDDDRR